MCVGQPKIAEHLFLACPDSYRDGSFGSSQKEQKKISISLSKDVKLTFLFFVLKGNYIRIRP
jgi:hypothetical protein